MKQLIYLADDEENIRILIRDFLKSDGYEVKTFETGDELYREFEIKEPNLVILDVMMPGSDGFAITGKIRERSQVPIIILTARDSEFDYVQGITLGGDDYLTKPFKPTVLLMRVRALLRRVEMDGTANPINEKPEDLAIGDLVFQKERNMVLCGGREVELTRTEQKMLTFMMENPEKSYSREELLDRIWGYEADVETRVTDETLRRIRRKLSQAKSSVSIQTVWGYGYRIVVSENGSAGGKL